MFYGICLSFIRPIVLGCRSMMVGLMVRSVEDFGKYCVRLMCVDAAYSNGRDGGLVATHHHAIHIGQGAKSLRERGRLPLADAPQQTVCNSFGPCLTQLSCHMLCPQVNTVNMAPNAAAWRSMYGRLGFSANAQTTLVDTEEITSLKDLRAIVSEERSRAVVKAIRRPGGNAAGESVSEKAEHNLRIAAYVACLWERTSRDSKTVADIILTPGTLFERAERQMQLEESWDNDVQQFEPASDSMVKNKFQEVYDNYLEMLEQVRGCTGIPLAYLC